MDAYTSFAEVYDMFMDNIPYEDWCGYLTSLLKEYGINDGLVLDLGCGTGTLTELLAKEGYDMIGVDVSEDMLQEAIEKRAESGLPILYLLQDMREFELYGTVRAVVSICDSLNYILDYDDLAHVFSLVNNYLDPEGVFIFDLNTPYKYRELIGDATIAENREDASFIWENTWYEREQVNEYDLTIFARTNGEYYQKFFENGTYERSWESGTEGNYNMVDGQVNNLKSAEGKRVERKPVQRPEQSSKKKPKKRESVIKRLREKQIAIAVKSGKPVPRYLEQDMERRRG